MLEQWAEEYGDGAWALDTEANSSLLVDSRFEGTANASLLKVPASSIARSVRAFGKETGVSFTSRRLTDANASRDVDNMLGKTNLALKVPREAILHPTQDGTIELPWIRPSAWIAYLLPRYPVLLSGSTTSKIESEFESFWEGYRSSHPGHEVFKHDQARIRRTLPLLLHGDEGRYLKRSNYLLVTVESVLGWAKRLKDACNCGCSSDPVLSRYDDLGTELDARARKATKQNCNNRGHCYLSKLLCFGMASKEYKAHPELMQEAFRVVSEDLKCLCEDGVNVPGLGRFWGGFLGAKGDLKFHVQIGNLSRAYHNLGRVQNKPICHICMAGADNIPFECLSDSPAWAESMFMSDPWPEDDEPSLISIPFDPVCRAGVFRLDVFHLWKVGQGRDLCGSSVTTLCRLGYFDFDPEGSHNIDDRLARAHSQFRLYCIASQKTPALRTFSKNNLMYPDQSSFSWFNCKGSDTTLLTRWLLFFLVNQVSLKDASHRRLLSAMKQCLNSAVVFFAILHTHGIFLTRDCAQRAQHHMAIMIRGFKACAQETLRLGVPAFGLKPKLHACHHISEEMRHALRSQAPVVVNPLLYSCESNEDMVGRISRLARRVSARLVNKRVMDRLMYKMKVLLLRKRMLRSRWGPLQRHA